jgi:hypothetical protein
VPGSTIKQQVSHRRIPLSSGIIDCLMVLNVFGNAQKNQTKYGHIWPYMAIFGLMPKPETVMKPNFFNILLKKNRNYLLKKNQIWP